MSTRAEPVTDIGELVSKISGEVPDFIVSGGWGGQFDTDSAEWYAFTCHSTGTLFGSMKKLSRRRAEIIAQAKVSKGREQDQKQFVNYIQHEVQEYVSREGVSVGAQTEERNRLFFRYAAFLNYVQVMGGWTPPVLPGDDAEEEKEESGFLMMATRRASGFASGLGLGL
ncbi:uncharacterized protein BDV17DRAFT_295555 [Aspergillus undulatus]|uniref:uncharacterized protein n=1 Tax=Aspergillus undulatus TaxID=1810928 RepID=UPI003CCCC73A